MTSKDKDIKSLQEILILEGRPNLASLLNSSNSSLNSSGQYGSMLFSEVTIFEILSPTKNTLILKRLPKEDHQLIFDSIVNIYPPRAHEPEIYGIEYLIDDSLQEENLIESSKHNLKKGVSAFISYSTEDKKIAGIISTELQKYGIDTFLAHETIEEFDEWLKVMEAELRDCDVFIPIFSDNFRQSIWTDQECGHAFAHQKVMLPLSLNRTPYGFLGKIQKFKIHVDNQNQHRVSNIDELCNKILKKLKSEKLITFKYRYSMISGFLKSENSEELEKKRGPLLFGQFTREESERLIRGMRYNPKVFKSAAIMVFVMTKDHHNEIDQTLIRGFCDEFNIPEKLSKRDE